MRSGSSFTLPPLAEVQGLYGPFTFSELLLQKLWWRREFASDGVRTVDGRTIKVVFPGRWNRLGGPDFKEAVIQIGEARVRGDVEVHLRAEDWEGHRHADDPAYDRVILHVVLFPSAQAWTRGAGGRAIPVLVLLPLLWHDLEEYASDDAVASLLDRADHRIAAELAGLPADELWGLLAQHSEARWRAKVRFASLRIRRLGWAAACHQTALEVLGYRSNRAGMLHVAEAWPLELWSAGGVDPEAVYLAAKELWKLQGIRPANHPRLRLRQYAAWAVRREQWPEWLLGWALTLGLDGNKGGEKDGISAQRRRLGFPSRWRSLAADLCGESFGGPRADTLIGDALLPLLTAREALSEGLGYQWWWAGYPGDLPDSLKRALRELGIADGREAPAARGPAQGLLGWLLDRELAEQRLASAGARQGA